MHSQMSTLKQIRAAYDELSTGYHKLLTASELYQRDAAQPSPHRNPNQLAPTPEKSAPEPVRISPVRKFAPKAGVLSEQDESNDADNDDSAGSGALPLMPVRPSSVKSSSGSRASGARQLAANVASSPPAVAARRQTLEY
jgi:hypothetical protein